MTEANVKPLTGQEKPALVLRVLRGLWRLASDRSHRNVKWLYWRRPKGAFQPVNDTRPDRYPRIFRHVQAELRAASEVRILSFGCATGEEVFSLRAYFPNAVIKGIDINPGNIAECRRRLKRKPDAGLSFTTGDTTAAEPTAAYDAIFCMAVLRHGGLGEPNVTRCDHLIRFEDFARMVEDFTRCLKPGGLLAIRHSNFRLCDAPAAAHYETVLRVDTPATAKRTPIFGADNRLMKDADYPDAVFRKIAKAGGDSSAGV